METFQKQVVEHVLGREVERHGTVVGGGELGKAAAQGSRGVGHVLHDVWSEPYFPDAQLCVQGEDGE